MRSMMRMRDGGGWIPRGRQKIQIGLKFSDIQPCLSFQIFNTVMHPTLRTTNLIQKLSVQKMKTDFYLVVSIFNNGCAQSVLFQKLSKFQLNFDSFLLILYLERKQISYK